MEKSTILVVDDSMSNLLLVKDILSSEPEYDVIVESEGENTVKILNNNKVDLILLDVMMPKVDGFEVCRRVKADLAFKDIPIIFLTAKVDESSLLEGFESGGVDYIKKPFLISEFIARVKTHLQEKVFDPLRGNLLRAKTERHLNCLSSLIQTRLTYRWIFVCLRQRSITCPVR